MKKLLPIVLLFLTSCTALGIKPTDTVAQAEQTLMQDADRAASEEFSAPKKKHIQKKPIEQTPDQTVSN